MRVLFLCENNSARSQMAEGLLKHLFGDKYEVFSAGSNPTRVNPFAIKVMAEIGIDISRQVSKSIEEFRNREIDLVVSVCRNSTKLTCSLCSSPIVMGRPDIINKSIPGAKHYLHHGFDDPSEVDGSDDEKVAAFRRTRDEIKQWIVGKFADPKGACSHKDSSNHNLLRPSVHKKRQRSLSLLTKLRNRASARIESLSRRHERSDARNPNMPNGQSCYAYDRLH